MRHPLSLIRRRLLLAPVIAAALPARAQVQAPAPVRESQVKAAFLHKFASFVEWPGSSFPRPDTPLRIAVVGDDNVWRDLDELARDRDRDGRPVLVSRLTPADSLAGQHIVYVRGSAARVADVLARVPEGVLTVADADGTHPRGSVLSFFDEDGRVRFGASIDAAARQKLRLSSRLLTVARLSSMQPEDANIG
jgi:hypothetical protein